MIEIEKCEVPRGLSRREWLWLGAVALLLVPAAIGLGITLGVAQDWLRGVRP